MREDIAKALLPIIHYQVDVWTCEASGRKFLGTHAHWVDNAFRLQHALLAVSGSEVIVVVFFANSIPLVFFFVYNALLGKNEKFHAQKQGGATE